MLPLVLALVLQAPPPQPPLPERVYQPHLIDPGLDAGAYHQFLVNAELTPDGKVLLAYRNLPPPGWVGYRAAFAASVVRKDRMNVDANGHLTGFFDPQSGTPFGTDFAFGSPSESKLIHYGFEITGCTSGGPCATCVRTPNPDYPMPMQFGQAHFTFAMQPDTFTNPDGIGNPYSSDAVGNPVIGGDLRCYELWVVRTHSAGYVGNLACQSTGEPFSPTVGIDDSDPIFVYQDVRVVIDESTSQVVHTAVGVFDPATSPLTSPWVGGDGKIRGIEPTITADGRLLVYHGNGSAPGFAIGNANLTYVYNANPCVPNGWTKPRSITELPPQSESGMLPADFQRRYPLFAQSVRLAPSAQDDDGHVFLPGESVRGAYPWVSKDGAFVVAKCAKASEAREGPTNPCNLTNSMRTRAGGFVLGNLTGGYVKLVDDVGVNPTRRGGPWHWPLYEPHPAAPNLCEYPNSWRSFSFSTGIKPGPWEPLLGQGAPIPTQLASSRIPVLPLFESEIDTYGEVRFEEADGNYLLYLACNESLRNDPASSPGELDVLFDTGSTADTSGRATRARSVLNAGAKFPQEIYGSSDLRLALGAAQLATTKPLHENVGYKGQAIVFNADGAVDARFSTGIAGQSAFTAQLFVKALATPPAGSTTTLRLLECGSDASGALSPLVTIDLKSNGKVVAAVDVLKNGLRTKVQVTSRDDAVSFGQNLFHSLAGTPVGSGWRHVAVTFDGSDPAGARLRLFLDGVLDKTVISVGGTTVWNAPGTAYCLVGPGRTEAPATVTDADKALVLDEIALSDVVRTHDELRRDAYVVPRDDGFEAWPSDPELDLPLGLEDVDAHWPAGGENAYRAEIVDLGQALFASTALSGPGVGRSCETCHVPSAHFASPGVVKALGITAGVTLPFNTPSLNNAAFGKHKLFDGSASSIEDQVFRPILSPEEMGHASVAAAVASVNGAFSGTFQTVFGEPADQENIARSLAMYVRTLNRGNAPYDRDELTTAQRLGKALFFGKAMCFSCHRDSNFSDEDFHNVLTVKTSEGIEGRKASTGRLGDLGRLKTPSLRNVASTGPWFHDGSKASLIGVIDHYNSPPFAATDRIGTADRELRALGLTQAEKANLIAFLHALTP